MSETKKTMPTILYENRTFVLTMLGVPVFGMAIAFVIIYWKKPDNMITALAVIFFLAVQYILMMFFWLKRVESLAKRDAEKELEITPEPDSNIKDLSGSEKVLLPEEERVFPSDKET